MAILKPTKSWTEIETTYQVPRAGEHPCVIKEITESKTKKSNLRQVTIKSEIDNPGDDDHGKPLYDFIVLEKKDGAENDVGFGKIKQYVEAVFGEERANDPEFELDTDDLLNEPITILVKHRSFTPEGESEPRVNAEADRILAR